MCGFSGGCCLGLPASSSEVESWESFSVRELPRRRVEVL
jgi:hypothetical protein